MNKYIYIKDFSKVILHKLHKIVYYSILYNIYVQINLDMLLIQTHFLFIIYIFIKLKF